MENQPYQQTPQNQNSSKKETTEQTRRERYYDEDEINLMDYFNVIKKRKKTIIAIFLVAAVTAAVYSLFLPKTFEAKTLLKVGLFKGAQIETLGNIETIFASDYVLQEIAKKLDLPVETSLMGVAGLFNIRVGGEEKSDFLEIKGRGGSQEKAVQTVNAIKDILLERHQKLFKEAEESFNMEVELIKRNQQKTEKDIENKEREIARLEEDIKYYDGEIRKRGDATSYAQGRLLEAYIGLLATAKNQKDDKLDQLMGLKKELANFDAVFQQKEYEKAYETRMTSVEALPVLPQARISPDRRQIVMIAGVLGLFIGIFWAFVAEYFSKQKERL